jgi:hypothetical protein
MTDGTYFSIQLFLIIFLTFIDGLSVVVGHPEWFQ